MFALDLQWWDAYIERVNEVFIGERFSTNKQNPKYNVTRTFNDGNIGNSGIGSMLLAIEGGCKKIIMLGYDCQKTGGKNHWHTDHPKAMGNAGNLNKWTIRFEMFKNMNPDVEFINATRETALTMFERKPLEEVLSLESE